MPFTLNKSHSAVKEILRKAPFSSTTILAKGGSSLVLDHGDNTVTKLTIDEHGYDWLSMPTYGMGRLNAGNPYKIEVIEDYGCVGEISYIKRMENGKTQQFDYMINAVRMPKLSKLVVGDFSKEEAERYRFLKKVFDVAASIQFTPDSANYFHHQAEWWGERHPEDDDFVQLITALYYMCADYHSRPDRLTTGNLLMYNGHIALVDPVFDPLLWANQRGYKNDPYQQPPKGYKNEFKKLVQA